MNLKVDHSGIKGFSDSWWTGCYWNIKWQQGRRKQDRSGLWGLSFREQTLSHFCHTDLFNVAVFSSASSWSLTKLPAAGGVSDTLQGGFWGFCVPLRVKAAQNELGQQILADFEEAFPSQGTKVNSHFPSPSHWKQFSVIGIGFSLIFPLGLLSACFL